MKETDAISANFHVATVHRCTAKTNTAYAYALVRKLNVITLKKIENTNVASKNAIVEHQEKCRAYGYNAHKTYGYNAPFHS